MNYQLSFLFFLLLLFLLWDVSYHPTYNPFDEDKKISVETLLGDGCELLYAPCGYETYGKEVAGNIIYYQYNPGKRHEVCAKGICIHIDSTTIESNLIAKLLSLGHQEGLLLIENQLEEVDSSKIIVPLSKFGVQNISYQEVDSSIIADNFLSDIETDISSLKQVWYFVDKKQRFYLASIDFKIAKDIHHQSVVIRTLELFIRQD